MPNDWFQFKQFRIEQHMCAMKVGTDGVILGAWTDVNLSDSVLDVGTGTGLLALMIAQRNESAQIDAVEIDQNACLQAKNNASNSLFHDRIEIFHRSLQEHILEDRHMKYDLVICNPPYFSASLKSSNDQRNIARHDDSLSLEMLISAMKNLLTERGRLSIILPLENEGRLLEALAENELHINRLLRIYPTPEKKVSRCCYEISAALRETIEEELVIETGGRHQYSPEYIALTDPFYL